MSALESTNRIAVVGAGIAGAACAASLQEAGVQVTLFDKSRAVGGRMSTRRAAWSGGDGTECTAEFDHGAQALAARQPRFRAMLARAESAGVVARWQHRVHATWPAPGVREAWVATPGMPALVRHLARGVPQRLAQAVQRLHRTAEGWHLVLAGGETAGPFDQVVLALPPAQAAVLLAGHHDRWADSLAAVPMAPCWTLMAATADVDWPWDAAEPARGPLAWVARNDRKPGRNTPRGVATWVAQATPAWSAAHLEADPATVTEALRDALQALLPPRLAGEPPLAWHHASVHRWRYAVPADRSSLDGRECWWDADRGLGVCGDFFNGGNVEAAWRSGDELADTVAAWLEQPHDTPVAAEAIRHPAPAAKTEAAEAA
jgi:predicted NAD/FAD-dependent oxidoreductase